MSEEEKKIIEKFKNFIYTYQDVIEDDFSDYEEKESAKEYQEVSEKILNYIDKLQKENERLKKNKVLLKINNGQIESAELINVEDKRSYISKDKIRNKIKELEEDVKDFEDYWSKDPRKFKKEKSIDYHKLVVLKELLGDDENE